MINIINTFKPNCIVETTNVCNLQCPGCYTENVLDSTNDKNKIYLTPDQFLIKISCIEDSGTKSIALRGGEPTLSPYIHEILEIASHKFNKVYLETHGLWILNFQDFSTLINVIIKNKIILKISFDRMHNSSFHKVQQIINNLNDFNISIVIAITAKNLFEFENIKQELKIRKEIKIYYQEFLPNKQKVLEKYNILN